MLFYVFYSKSPEKQLLHPSLGGITKENFVFRSLIRTFELGSKVLSFGKAKEKQAFLLLFAHLFVPLHPYSR